MPDCLSSRCAEKRQRTAALQDAGALFDALVLPQGFGVRQSSAALSSLVAAGNHWIQNKAEDENEDDYE